MTDRADEALTDDAVVGTDRAPGPSSAPVDPSGGLADGVDTGGDGPHPVRRIVRFLAWAVFAYVMVVEVILLIGFVCLLFGIEPASWFVDIVYRSVDRTMQPFRSLFTAIEFGTGSSGDVEPRIESAIVFAMIVYGIIALAAHDLAEWVGRPRRQEPTPT